MVISRRATTYNIGHIWCDIHDMTLLILYTINPVYEGVEEYSCKYFAERKERQRLVEKGDGPLVGHSCICYSHTIILCIANNNNNNNNNNNSYPYIQFI